MRLITIPFSVCIILLSVSPHCFSATYPSQEECQKQTSLRCSFVMCDYIPPGKTFAEVCGEDFKKGWGPSPYIVRVSAEEMAEVQEINFKTTAPFSDSTITILGNGRFHYRVVNHQGNVIERDGALDEGQMLELTGLISNKNFFRMHTQSPDRDIVPDSTVYDLNLKVRTFKSGKVENTIYQGDRHVHCRQDVCPDGFADIKKLIISYFGNDYLEVGV